MQSALNQFRQKLTFGLNLISNPPTQLKPVYIPDTNNDFIFRLTNISIKSRNDFDLVWLFGVTLEGHLVAVRVDGFIFTAMCTVNLNPAKIEFLNAFQLKMFQCVRLVKKRFTTVSETNQLTVIPTELATFAFKNNILFHPFDFSETKTTKFPINVLSFQVTKTTSNNCVDKFPFVNRLASSVMAIEMSISSQNGTSSRDILIQVLSPDQSSSNVMNLGPYSKVYHCRDEQHLLSTWVKIIRIYNPDILTDHQNVIPYLVEKIRKCSDNVTIYNALGRLKLDDNEGMPFTKEKLFSGRCILDNDVIPSSVKE